MTLTNYICDLLYRYNCVIVPNFGGFVTNTIGAKINSFSHTFYPPKKQITFNAHLKNNDGLLANYIATSQKISFEEACDFIAKTVMQWQKQLQNESLILTKIGNLSLSKEKQFVFEPNTTTNYLPASFGLTAVSSPAITRESYKKQAEKLTVVTNKNNNNSFFKYAATAAVLLTLGIVGWNGYQANQQQKLFAKQQKNIEHKIQQATFVIQNPLPTIELTVNKAAKNYHIVAGAFQFPKNAAKKLAQLKKQGFDAHIIGKNRWGLTQVAYASLTTRVEALKKLSEIKKNNSKDAWLFIKKAP